MRIVLSLSFMLFFGCNNFAWAFSAGPPASRNGLDGQYCTACHRTNALNSGKGNVRIEGIPLAWFPGETYNVRVMITHEGSSRWGFQLSATGENGQQAGDFLPGADGRTATVTAPVNGSQVQFIRQTSVGTGPGGTNSYEFRYRAPATAANGTIRLHLAGNAANGNNANTGDFIYATEAAVPVAMMTNNRSFTFGERGGASVGTANRSAATVVGHARIQPGPGSPAPSGVAILGWSANNVTISEASFTATRPLRSGRIFTDIGDGVNTSVAIVNPGSQAAMLSYFFTDEGGTNFGHGGIALAPNTQVTGLLDQAPFYRQTLKGMPVSRSRSFTINSTVPVSMLAMRGSTDERAQFLMAPLPVTDLSASSGDPVSIPVFVDGGGSTTEVLLLNPTDATLNGSIEFLSSGGKTLTVSLAGAARNRFNYSIPPRSSRRLSTGNTVDTTVAGSIRIVPVSGATAPAAAALLSTRAGDGTVSESMVEAVAAGSAFRIYVENAGDFAAGRPGAIQSGFAIANPGADVSTVTLDLTALNGVSSGFTASLLIPARGQTAVFLNEIPRFASLPLSFQGVLRVSTTSASGIAVTGMRGHYSESSSPSLIVSGMPAFNENSALSSEDLVFPQVLDSGGFTTQIVVFSGLAGQRGTGNLRFYSPSGQPLTLTTR